MRAETAAVAIASIIAMGIVIMVHLNIQGSTYSRFAVAIETVATCGNVSETPTN